MNASRPNPGERVRDVRLTEDTLAVDLVDGRTIIFHAGGINGFTSTLVYYPESQVTIAVLSNVANTDDGVVRRLSALVHGDAP